MQMSYTYMDTIMLLLPSAVSWDTVELTVSTWPVPVSMDTAWYRLYVSVTPAGKGTSVRTPFVRKYIEALQWFYSPDLKDEGHRVLEFYLCAGMEISGGPFKRGDQFLKQAIAK